MHIIIVVLKKIEKLCETSLGISSFSINLDDDTSGGSQLNQLGWKKVKLKRKLHQETSASEKLQRERDDEQKELLKQSNDKKNKHN